MIHCPRRLYYVRQPPSETQCSSVVSQRGVRARSISCAVFEQSYECDPSRGRFATTSWSCPRYWPVLASLLPAATKTTFSHSRR